MTGQLLDIARTLLPDAPLAGARVARGQFHDVVLLPGTAAVRVARSVAAAAELPRRTALLGRLAAAGLPFAVPTPLTPVTTVGGQSAVALSWVPGKAAPAGEGDPAALRGLLAALAGVDLGGLEGLLGPPHCYAGGYRWEELLRGEVIPRLPAAWRAEATRRVDAALALPPVPASLVHGDLAGHNVHWSDDGRTCLGVLDWDLAQLYDPAADVACLAWHGWDTVRAAVDPVTFARARVWFRTFGLEQVSATILLGDPPEPVVDRAVVWLTRTA